MRQDERPTLGIVIPSYGRPEAVRRAVRSVIRQRALEEIVVVDDASPLPIDLSDMVDPRLRVIRREANGGVCAARNTGTEAATSSHVIYLDDDDALYPWAGWFYRRWIAGAARRGTDRIAVGAIVVEAGRGRSERRRPPSSSPGEIWGLDRHLTDQQRSVNTKQAAAIPKALVERVGGWDEALRSRSSSEMFYRLSAVAAIEGHRIPVYRLNRGGHDKLTTDPAKRMESYEYVCAKYADLLADPARRSAFEATHRKMMKRSTAA